MRNLLKPKAKKNPFVKCLKGIKVNCAKIEYNRTKTGLLWRPKNIMLADVNGTELEFPELDAPEEVQVGVKVNVNGQPATGEYQFPDGTVLVCKDGTVTNINYPNSETKSRHRKVRFVNSLK